MHMCVIGYYKKPRFSD